MFAAADASIDKKCAELIQLYGDNTHVSTSLKDIEQMRSSAQNLGIAVSVAAFGLNEVARLTLRSRKSPSSERSPLSAMRLASNRIAVPPCSP